VLDFSALLPGPFASAILAAAGAQVTKIERPEGDGAADVPPFVDGRPVLYDALNANKTIIRLDIRSAEGREAALRFAEKSDIMITQVRPGVMERLGLGYEDVQQRNKSIIYCAITGYGQNGPFAKRAGHDLNYLADGGLLAARAGDPVVLPGLFADVGGGTLPAVINILLALRMRDLTGQGSFLDISIVNNVRAFAPQVTSEESATGRFDAEQSLFGGRSPRYRIYSTQDGGHVVVGAMEEKFWRRFCDVLGLPALPDQADDRAAATKIADRIGSRPTASWRKVFQNEDCCVSIIDKSDHISVARVALQLPISPQFRVHSSDRA
jgi:crotonobetainyl-CoA:carnitine CoA-transferase CaiB-like acyl-CoA transferase